MIGTQIGNLRIVRRLGAGAMGTVFLAEHVLGGAFAVKVLSRELAAANPSVVQRFWNEARIEQALKHQNVVRVSDAGVLPSGEPYMVLDYLDGASLDAFIHARGGPIDPYTTLHIICEIAAGLDHAHAHAYGIVHRDIKPANIFLTVEGTDALRVKVLDFGVALLRDKQAAGGVETQIGALVGTPSHMPPEQLNGAADVGRAVDVFALAVIAYQMLTGGRLPWQDDSDDASGVNAPELFHRQRTRPPTDPRRYHPSLSDALVRAIVRSLDNDPAKRHASCGAFAVELARALPGDNLHPAGVAIVKEFASDVLRNAGETGDAMIRAATNTTASRYLLGKPLGVGGMAEVFLASHTGAAGFERQVAIKRVLPGFSEQPKFAAMFIEEARIISALNHPNIVSVLDFDRDADGRLFLAMEYVDGKDLSSVADSGPLPVSVVIFVVIEILRGLKYAHQLPEPVRGIVGVVHRDMSPNNVLISWEGTVKINDFGIAKVRESTGPVQTQIVKGKPSYMSPEQINAEPLDGRSDLFAVGIIFWELLVGREMFPRGLQEALAQVLFGKTAPPSALRADVPADVEAVVMKLLQRDRSLRYATAEQAIDDLSRCAAAPRDGRGELTRLLSARFPRSGDAPLAALSELPITAAASVRAMAPLVAPTTLGQAASQLHVSAARPSRRWALFIGACAAITIAGVVVGVLARRSSTTEATSPAVAIPNIDAGAIAAASITRPVAPDAAAVVVVPDAMPVDAAVIADAAPSDAPLVEPVLDAGTPTTPPSPHVAIVTGELDVAAVPWAVVYLDSPKGRRLGQTPLHTRVPVGSHRVFLVNPDHHLSKTVNVTVTASEKSVIDDPW